MTDTPDTPAVPEPETMSDILDRQAARNVLKPARDVLKPAVPEPVAYMHELGAIWRLDNYPAGLDFTDEGWTALVPATQMQALADRLAECEVSRDGWKSAWYALDQDTKDYLSRATTAEAALADMTSDYLRRHNDAVDFMERALVAEAALESARKVIKRIASGEVFGPVAFCARETNEWKECRARMDFAAEWLSANPKETKG